MRSTVCLLAAWAGAVIAAAPPAAPPAALTWIDQLGEDDTHRGAAGRLAKLGERAVPLLRKAAKTHADPDVRLRASVVAAAIEARLYPEVRRFVGSQGGVGCLALAPDGKRMVSGCWGNQSEKVARVWDISSGKGLFELKGHAGTVNCMAWSKDGRRILTGSIDRSVRLWDASGGKLLLTIPEAHPGWLHSVLFTEDGRQAVSCGSDSAIVVWDLTTGKEVKRIGIHAASVRGLARVPGGKEIASASFDGSVRIIDLESGKEVRRMGDGHLPGQAWFVAVSPDGKRIASAGSDKMVRLWDAGTGRQLREFAGHTDSVHGVAYSADGRRLLSAGYDGTVRLWDVEAGKAVQLIELGDAVSCVVFLPDGAHAVISCNDKTLRLWRLRK